MSHFRKIGNDNACHQRRRMIYCAAVSRMSRVFKLRTVFRKTSAVLLCGVVLFLAALAASPSLHEWLHHDADEPGHECAVTLFLHGQVSAAAVAPVVAAVAALFGGIPL